MSKRPRKPTSDQPCRDPRSDMPPAAARILRESRVDQIVGLMTSGAWSSARSIRDLTTEWNVSVGAVQDYAREASGIIRHALSGHEDEIRLEGKQLSQPGGEGNPIHVS